jgi:hypothetical protein
MSSFSVGRDATASEASVEFLAGDLYCPTCGDHFRALPSSAAPQRFACGHAVCSACEQAVAATPEPVCPVCLEALPFEEEISFQDVHFGQFCESILASSSGAVGDAECLPCMTRPSAFIASAAAGVDAPPALGSLEDIEEASQKKQRALPVSELRETLSTLCQQSIARMDHLATTALPFLQSQFAVTTAAFDAQAAATADAYDAIIAELLRQRSWHMDTARATRADFAKRAECTIEEATVSLSQIRAVISAAGSALRDPGASAPVL